MRSHYRSNRESLSALALKPDLTLADASSAKRSHTPEEPAEQPAKRVCPSEPRVVQERALTPDAPEQTTYHHDDFLDQLGMTVVQPYGVLICIACRTSIPPQDIFAHWQGHHQTKTVPVTAELCVALATKYSLLAPKFIKLPVRPIYEIRHLDVVSGFQCSECSVCFEEPDNVTRHFKSDHAELRHRASWPSVRMQRFFKVNAMPRIWFPVKTLGYVANPTPQVRKWNQSYASAMQDYASTMRSKEQAAQDRSPLMRITNWDEALEGCDLVKLAAMSMLGVNPNKFDDDEGADEAARGAEEETDVTATRLFDMMSAYVSHLREQVLPAVVDEVLCRIRDDHRCVSVHPSFLSIDSPSRSKLMAFRMNQMASTTGRYMRLATRLVLINLRALSPHAPIKIEHTPGQLVALQDLTAALQLSVVPDDAPTVIQKVLWTLSTETFGVDRQGQFHCALTLATIILALNEDGGWLQLGAISSNLAAFKWIMQSSVVYEVMIRAGLNMGVQLEAWLVIESEVIKPLGSPFASISRSLSHLNLVIQNAPPPPRFVWDPSPRREWLMVDGKTVFLKNFYSGIRAAVDLLESILNQNLLRGHSFALLEAHLEECMDPMNHQVQLWDDWTNTTEGYSFLEDPRNPIIQESRDALFKILVKEEGFGLVREGDDFVLDNNKVTEYFQQQANFVDVLFFITHATGTGTFRGTELNRIKFANLAGCEREMQAVIGLFLFLCSYHKTDHAHGLRGASVRGVPRRVTLLVAKYLILVIGVVSRFAYDRLGKCEAYEATRYLFWTHRGILKPVQASAVMFKLSARHLPIPFGLSLFRQFCVALVRQPREGQSEAVDWTEEEDPFERVMHNTFGHASPTSETHYGKTALEVLSARGHRLSESLVYIIDWHERLGFPSGRPTAEVQDSGAAIAGHIQDMACHVVDIVRREVPLATHQLLQSLCNRMQATLMDLNAARPPPALTRLTIAPSHAVAPLALHLLQRLTGNEEAQFRTLLQAAYADAIVRGEFHVLYVAETGGGKSFIPLIATLMTKEVNGIPRPMRILYVAPFVTLYYGVSQLLTRLRIEHVLWKDQTDSTRFIGSSAPVMLISLEHATDLEAEDGQFGAMLEKWSKIGEMDKIIIDEISLMATQSLFRPALLRLAQLASSRAQFILPSATLSPAAEMYIYSRLNLLPQSVMALREEFTVRPNIRITVRPECKHPMAEMVKHIEETTFADPKDRRIIFCRSVADMEALAELITCVTVSGKDSHEQRLERMESWTRGDVVNLVGSSALFFGYHYPHVREGLALNLLHNLEGETQAQGRIGRDGGPADFIQFYSYIPGEQTTEDTDGIHSGKQELARAYRHPPNCRRAPAALFFNGKGITCFAIPGALLCDLCRDRQVSSFRSSRLFPDRWFQTALSGVHLELDIDANQRVHEESVPRMISNVPSVIAQTASLNHKSAMSESAMFELLHGFGREQLGKCVTHLFYYMEEKESHVFDKCSVRGKALTRAQVATCTPNPAPIGPHSICHRCTLPHLSIPFHHPVGNTLCQGYEDVFPPLLYHIYKSSMAREILIPAEVLAGLGSDLEKYRLWLGMRAETSEFSMSWRCHQLICKYLLTRYG